LSAERFLLGMNHELPKTPAITYVTINLLFRLIDAKLSLTELYWLVAYPIMLLYACFVIITVF
jgi:hypothetical protein